jgi:PIN domain nuclease of toxin-antitoxin system
MSSLEMIIERTYVVDTHALIWYLTKDRKLGKQAAEVFRAAERVETAIVISAIVIAEMYHANGKQKLFADFKQTYHDLKVNPQYQFAPVLEHHILDFDQDIAVREMHDRIIVGLARRLNAPLLTLDPKITAANLVRIIW